jgi:hypothetical protein
MVRVTTSLAPEHIAVYRRAAHLMGKTRAQVLREALEDGVTAMHAAIEVSEHLDAGRPLEAIRVFERMLTERKLEETQQRMALTEAIHMAAGANAEAVAIAAELMLGTAQPPSE